MDSASVEIRSLRADLDTLWEKFSRLHGRLAKRGDLTPDQPRENQQAGSPQGMTERAAQAQAAIERRRGIHRVS
ncbi:MAG TPA: hypothetical protein VHO48_05020 [Anaerolineaceae bacterium]|nr:hypothetical protein [Anaerolineaceae bacterium]